MQGGNRLVRQIHRPVFAALPLPDDKLLSIERFASADTIVPDPTNPQSYNRYTYVFNNPLRFADPTVHYGKEVHEYLTRQLAYIVGRNVLHTINMNWASPLSVDAMDNAAEVFASIIASYNQGTDEDWATSPLKIFSEIDGMTPSEYYHFQSRSEAKERLQSAINKGRWDKYGVALHTFQDYFSHVGSGFSFPTGEAGITDLQNKCPECFSGNAYASDPFKKSNF